jgi:predicted AlkP superfamily pyrophosphatase or phosphodiesterase
MKMVKTCLILLILCFEFSTYCQQKTVLVLLDGIPADVIEKVNTPVLDEIAKAGGYTRSYQGGEIGKESETPTISAPGYMNLITGTWAYKHNVWGNGVKDPNYDYWNIFRIVKALDPNKRTAIFSTWEDNRTKLIGDGLTEAGGKVLDYAFDGFEKDTVAFPHDDGQRYFFNIDEHVSKEAGGYLKKKGPDVSWIYLEFTDNMGHMFGDSPQMYDAVTKVDTQVGRIWSALKYREKEFKENWMIVITTDHGRSPKDGKGHGGQSDRERTTWIVTNNSELKPSFYQNPPVVDILPSILDHMKIVPPSRIKDQFDGRSFIMNN